MKSDGAHVGTLCYLNPSLVYTMHTLRFNMILIYDQHKRGREEGERAREMNIVIEEKDAEKEKDKERDILVHFISGESHGSQEQEIDIN